MTRLPDRYTLAAPVHDLLPSEPLVYRAGREAGVAALALREGEVALDVGCGTGLALPALAAGVGPTGHVLGLDASAAMLARARRRAAGLGTPSTLLLGDGTDPHDPAWATVRERRPDAVLLAYALSVSRPWTALWENVVRHVPSGTRVCVVDMADPGGAAAPRRPLARLACALGGADITAHPWRRLEREGADVIHRRLRGGHVRVVSGRLP